LNWLVVVVMPANDFLGQVYDSLRTMLNIGIVALVIATILGFLVATRIIRPITNIANVATAIERGQYDLEPLEPIAARSDELGRLARVFKEMATRVHARQEPLQQEAGRLQIA